MIARSVKDIRPTFGASQGVGIVALFNPPELSNIAQQNIQTRITISSPGEIFRRFQKNLIAACPAIACIAIGAMLGVMDYVVPDPDSS